MDGFRFDDLARAVAGGTSRRSVLKGLAATLAAAWFPLGVPRAARAQNTVPLGGQCSALGANSECSQAGGAVVCSDNGIIRDGQFNCCRNAGGGVHRRLPLLRRRGLRRRRVRWRWHDWRAVARRRVHVYQRV
jgi:hypothetical protein